MTVLNEDNFLIDTKSSKPDFNPSINKIRDRLKSISSIDHIKSPFTAQAESNTGDDGGIEII